MAKAKPKKRKVTYPKARKPKPGTKPAVPQTSTFISERNLLALARQSDETKAKTASIGGGYRESIAYAVEHQGLNKTAFNMADRLRRLFDKDKPEAQGTLDHLLYYINCFKLRSRGTKGMKFEPPAEPKAEVPKSGPGTPTPESDLAKVGRGDKAVTGNVTSINEAKKDDAPDAKAA